MAQYNWHEIFEKYKTGKYTMAELAKDYGFNAKYGARKAKKNGIEKGESRKKVEKEAGKKVREEEVNKEVKLRKEYEKIITNIRRLSYHTLIEEKDFARLKQFKIFSEILRNCRKEQWEVNEIQEVAKKLEQEVDINELPDINLVRGDKGGG